MSKCRAASELAEGFHVLAERGPGGAGGAVDYVGAVVRALLVDFPDVGHGCVVFPAARPYSEVSYYGPTLEIYFAESPRGTGVTWL